MSDLISRQAAIDYCCQLINVEHQQGSDEMNYGHERVNQTETILHHLEIMPSAEPKTGHWIGHREHCENLGVIPSGLGAYEWCSNCDCGIDVREWHRNHYNYCPNCGARMEREEDDF